MSVRKLTQKTSALRAWQTGFAVVVLIIQGCTSQRLADFDQRAFDSARTLQTSTAALIESSKTEFSFPLKQAAIDTLLSDLETAHVYAGSFEYNDEARDNWRDLTDGMVRPWLVVWRENGSLSEPAADDFKEQMIEAFNTLICIEQIKRDSISCPALAQ